MNKIILITIMILMPSMFNGQILISTDREITSGFMYSKGIMWTENKKQDSVIKIIIEGDTMAAIRNLLEYCMREKEENEHSYYLLSRINLDYLAKTFKDKDFNYYLKEYKKVVAKNKKKNEEHYKNSNP